ncbi:hypothetical protein CDAR_441421 [Caerostris darwini]|uniref:Uncharacterized protein n=1 Tax=Caerostris darwini TaxID=1538125 RepID=A0AAV4TLU7_9ARAC|nr:hypothetical protein CDAR_441421 [Caerostris darwini]
MTMNHLDTESHPLIYNTARCKKVIQGKKKQEEISARNSMRLLQRSMPDHRYKRREIPQPQVCRKEFASIKLSRKLSPPSPSFTYQVWANKG